MRGSRALRMAPKPPALTELTGPLKFERLKKLKNSARKLAVKPSRMVKAFDTPKSVLKSPGPRKAPFEDRKSTRLNSSHSQISYAVFCLKKKIHNYVLCNRGNTINSTTITIRHHQTMSRNLSRSPCHRPSNRCHIRCSHTPVEMPDR